MYRTNAEYQLALERGYLVWCDFAEQEARTADRFCEFCGATDHHRVPEPPR